MKKLIPTLMLFSTFSYASSTTTVENYKKLGTEFLQKLENKAIKNTKEASKAGQALVSSGEKVIKELMKTQKECRPFLSAVLKDLQKMTSLSHEEIEKNYHKGAALPKTTALCNELKELVVHPATVVILAGKKTAALSQEVSTAMYAEIDEVINHIDNVGFLVNSESKYENVEQKK